MRIGQLAEETGTSRRLLRYYEEQQLILPHRERNGYRDYDPRNVDRVLQIRSLLDAGLPTRIIKQILPCLDKPRTIHFRDATPEMLELLEHERDKLDRRIDCLARNRDAMTEYLDDIRRLQGCSTDASEMGEEETTHSLRPKVEAAMLSPGHNPAAVPTLSTA
ncbi:MerR family transcriptional regulator [Rhodococcus sp. NPDC057135]|uniref:MerR family transcriptional regulator n=1 Tax=Rhodococcus sp. NPDC057135 TaxID=3346028 RepID=UPI00363B1755